MRLLRLDLIAWGHFVNASLDLSAPGLHVVYGPNEAGKSTARRAVTALLFGVPRGTPDAFAVPKPTDVRVGGRVMAAHGEPLELVRRGGLKNTLLSPTEDVLPDETLLRLLGVGEEAFSAVFSMDHATLREGAEAILRGGGDLGESLAAAALGDARLSKAAARFRAREVELYNPAPNAKKSQLHEALRAYKEAKQELGDAESSPEAYEAQRMGVVERRAAYQEAVARAREARVRRARLDEVQRARPVVNERARTDARLAELSEVPLLRAGLETELGAIVMARRQAEGRLDVVVRERRALVATDARAGSEVSASCMHWLPVLRRGLAKAEARKERLAHVSRLLELRARAIAASEVALGPLARAPDVARALVQQRAVTVRLVEEAAEQKGLMDQALRRARELGAQVERATPDRAKELEGALGPLETAMLFEQRALAVLHELDATGTARETLGLEVELLARELFAPDTPVRDILALDLPAASRLLAIAERRNVLSTMLAKLEGEAAQVSAHAREAQVDLSTQRSAFQVPTDAELTASRAARDRAISELAMGVEPLLRLNAARIAVAAADALADRMRREVERVLAYARLEHSIESFRERGLELDAQRDAVRGDLHAEGRAELEVVVSAGGRVRDVEDLMPFRTKLDALLVKARALAEARAAHEAAKTVERELCAAYARALAASGAPPVDVVSSLADARALLLARREDLRTRIAVLREREEADQRALAELRAAEAAVEKATLAHEAAAEAARGPLEALGVSPRATPKEVLERFEAISELLRELAARDALAAERQDLLADEAAFARDVAGAAAELGEAHAALEAPRLAADLATRLELAERLAAEALRDAEADRKLAHEQSELEATLAGCRRDQAELFASASVHDEASFLRVVREAEEKVALVEKRRRLDDELGRLAQACTVPELAELVASLSVDVVESDLATLEADLEVLEDEVRRDLEAALATEQGLQRYHTQDLGAARAAEDAAFHAARVRELAESWLAERAARRLLERRIERYREENQGPVLERASAHFRALTANAYAGVAAALGRDDTVKLHARRLHGVSLELSELSDGTRDQLFLALRVASLERLAALGTRAPVVLDDALVHFDDARARAALSVMATLAESHTVVFFTHHAHLVDLARAALGSRVVVHALEKGQGA